MLLFEVNAEVSTTAESSSVQKWYSYNHTSFSIRDGLCRVRMCATIVGTLAMGRTACPSVHSSSTATRTASVRTATRTVPSAADARDLATVLETELAAPAL